ncbi:MAG: cupin domain-containing protein [Candidatus Electrothrix sp. ATG1]|nr:cupin domain-containing protein [Candidatus Electrothrix sp. ATG1]MCI5212425.1 cupin domain-containing protein [Candidatus Electrothrix sp. ATG2]
MTHEMTVKKLTEIADYQEESIVSSTIINKLTGTVTLFAFDKDQSLSEHTASYDALVQVLEGEAEITVSGKLFQVRQGEMLIMPEKEPHTVRAVTRFKMMLTMIKS